MRSVRRGLLMILCIGLATAGTANADFRFGKKIIVREGCTIDDAFCFGSDVHIYGTVKKTAVSIGGNVVVKSGGTLKGDAVSIGGDVIIQRNAVIRNDAVTLGGHVRIDNDGEVHGESVEILDKLQNELGRHGGNNFAGFGHSFEHWREKIPRIFLLGPFAGIFGVFGFLVMSAFLIFKLAVKLGIAALITYIFPQHVHIMADCARLEFWKASIIGVAGIVAIPVIFLFLLVSILGIAILPLYIGLLFLVYLFGSVGVALCVGRILPIAEGRSDIRNALLGVLAIGLIRFFPLLGVLVGMAVTALSFGVVILTRFGTQPSTTV